MAKWSIKYTAVANKGNEEVDADSVGTDENWVTFYNANNEIVGVAPRDHVASVTRLPGH